jgi:hypothetical protein
VAEIEIGRHSRDQERIFLEFEQVDFSYGRHQQGRAAGPNPFARSNPTNDFLTPPRFATALRQMPIPRAVVESGAPD